MINKLICGALLLAIAVAAAQATDLDLPRDHVLVLSETIAVKVHSDGSSVEDRTEMLKALDAIGARELQAYRVPYQAQRQSVSVVDGSAVTGDAPEVPLGPSDIRDQVLPAAAGAPAYSNSRQVTAQFHGVSVGTVVRIHVRRVTRQPFLPGMFSAFDVLPRTRPIQEFSYELTAPGALRLQVEAGGVKGGMTHDGDTDHWSFIAAKLPALYNVATTSALIAKSPYVVVSGAGTDANLAKAYVMRTRAPQHISLELQQLADSIGADAIDPDTLTKRYYAWINDHVRLVDLPLQMGLTKPRAAQDILLSGYGTAEDRVIVLQALMGAKGLGAEIGLVPSMPVSWNLRIAANTSFYDRVLLIAGGGRQALDIGEPVLELGEYGPRDRGKFGVRMSPTGQTAPFQVPVPDAANFASSVSTQITFGKDGSLVGTAKIADFGDAAATDRRLLTLSPTQFEAMLGRHAPRGMELKLSSMDEPAVAKDTFDFGASFHLAGYQEPLGGYRMRVPRPIVGPSSMDDFASVRGAGLCQRTWRQEMTEIRFDPIHPLSLPANVDQVLPGGLGSYRATYASTADGRLTVKRTLSLEANPVQCDHQQQAELAKLASAVRADLATEVEVQR